MDWPLRLQEAIRLDFEWWKPMNWTQVYRVSFAEAVAGLERERAGLLARLLGADATGWRAGAGLGPSPSFQLTGPVLGALPASRFWAVVEICSISEERVRQYQRSCFSQGEPIDPAAEARLRDRTRVELARILSAEELEEFLVRNSHNAEVLRAELEGLKPTREEFLKIFRVLDPIRHRMQLDYGGESALSLRQRDEYERQCQQAVREGLPPERFKTYLAGVDACYRRARAEAEKWKLDEPDLTRLHEFYRAQALKREKTVQDQGLSVEEKNRAVQQLTLEEDQFLAKLIRSKRTGAPTN